MLIFAQDPDRGLAGLKFFKHPRQDIVLELEPGAYVTAEVVDLNGDPVAEASAYVWVSYDVLRGTRLPLAGISDAQGHVDIGPLPTQYPVEPGLSMDTSRMAVNEDWPQLRELSLRPGERRELPALVLKPPGRIAFASADLYLAGTTDLRRVKGIVRR